MKAFKQVWHLQVVTPALQRLLLLHLAKCAGLSAEEHALQGARLPVPVQAVVSSTAWLRTGYRDTTTGRAAR